MRKRIARSASLSPGSSRGGKRVVVGCEQQCGSHGRGRPSLLLFQAEPTPSPLLLRNCAARCKMCRCPSHLHPLPPLSGERPSARQPLACPSRQLQHKFRVDPLRVLKRGRRYVSGATCGQEHAAADATKQRPKQQQGRAGDKTSRQAGRQQTSERERSEAQASEGSAAPADCSPRFPPPLRVCISTPQQSARSLPGWPPRTRKR